MAGRQGAGVEDLAARGAVLQIVPGREPATERALWRRRLRDRRRGERRRGGRRFVGVGRRGPCQSLKLAKGRRCKEIPPLVPPRRPAPRPLRRAPRRPGLRLRDAQVRRARRQACGRRPAGDHVGKPRAGTAYATIAEIPSTPHRNAIIILRFHRRLSENADVGGHCSPAPGSLTTSSACSPVRPSSGCRRTRSERSAASCSQVAAIREADPDARPVPSLGPTTGIPRHAAGTPTPSSWLSDPRLPDPKPRRAEVVPSTKRRQRVIGSTAVRRRALPPSPPRPSPAPAP